MRFQVHKNFLTNMLIMLAGFQTIIIGEIFIPLSFLVTVESNQNEAIQIQNIWNLFEDVPFGFNSGSDIDHSTVWINSDDGRRSKGGCGEW